MRTAPLAAALVAAAALLAGCSGGTVSVSAGPTAASAPAAGASLESSDFAAAAKLPGTVLLDVRTPAEFAQGHLPGAVNVDVESAEPNGFVFRVTSPDYPAVMASCLKNLLAGLGR